MENKNFKIKTEGSIEHSKKGLETINDTILNVRELVENEFAKNVNTWTSCVVSRLNTIQAEAEWLNTALVTQEYKDRVEKDIQEILLELRKIDEPKQEHLQEAFDHLATDPEEKKFVMPPEDQQNYIYSLIFNLTPRQDELK